MEMCFCGSGISLQQCCRPAVPPIYSEAPRFIRSSKFHMVHTPSFINSIRVSYSVNNGPAILSQVAPVIAEALGFDLSKVLLFTPSERNTLVFPLHAVQYHLQQFMHRLKFLQREVLQAVLTASNDPRVDYIQCEDISLRSEFEAYIIRLSAYLDAVAQYMVVILGISKDKGSHNKLQNYLEKETGTKRKDNQVFREIYETNQAWTKKLIRIRNQVMHEGISMDMDIPTNIIETKSFVPKLGEDPIDGLVIEFWRNTLKFTKHLIEVTRDVEPKTD